MKPVPGKSAMECGLRLAAVCALALSLAGCKTTDDPTRVAGWTLVDATQRHPILVSQEPTTLAVRVRRGASGLNSAQRAELVDFQPLPRDGRGQQPARHRGAKRRRQ